MDDYTQITLPFACIEGKKVIADFNGGNVTSDSGVLFLREMESKVGIIKRIVGCIDDKRHPSYTRHSIEEMIRQRVFQISCGYPDADDCDDLRHDPAMKAACDRLPITGEDLASQPTVSRLENALKRKELYRIAQAFLDVFIDSYAQPPEAIILDIDDTDDPTHGAQQLTLFNAYYDEYCFMPLHLYEGQTGKLITTILRPGKRPTGEEIVSILKRVLDRIREAWPQVTLFFRGDSHFSTPEVHDCCEEIPNCFYILGQTGNKVLKKRGEALLKLAMAMYASKQEKVVLFQSFEYKADSRSKSRRIVYKVEVTEKGTNQRFVVTNLTSSQPSFIYRQAYCGRGRMESFIKNHKTYLYSDRTSCHDFSANQFRLFLHSAAYVLLHTLEQTGLRGTQWAKAQFDTIQKYVFKVGSRVRELKTKVTFHLPTSFPFKEVFLKICNNLAAAI